MTASRYPEEILNVPREVGDDSYSYTVIDWEDNGTMPASRDALAAAVVGRRIVKAERATRNRETAYWDSHGEALVLTLDDGTEAVVHENEDCCASTEVTAFFLDPSSVDHVILGVGTTEHFTKWHIYADFGDVMTLDVGWSAGNPFYYGYGFTVEVQS